MAFVSPTTRSTGFELPPTCGYVFSVSQIIIAGEDSALRCPRAVQARNGWGKINHSLVPPLDAAETAQRAVPTTVNLYPRRSRASGFTLLELLIVISIVTFLAALLMPSMAAARSRARQVSCQSNLRQLALCLPMYSADNGGKLAENLPGSESPDSWVRGNMTRRQDMTNELPIIQGKLYPYASHANLYRCPADSAQLSGVPRVRSYSMNGWVGSRYMDKESQPNRFRTFVRESELTAAGPASIWQIIDEHETSIDDAWFLVTMDDSHPFASFPSTRHALAYNLDFGDGHVQLCKLRDPQSQSFGQEGVSFSPRNSDWLQLRQITTIQ